MDIELVYVGNGYYQTTKRVPDDSPSGSDYWSCYVPRPIAHAINIHPEQHKTYRLTLVELTEATE